MKWMKEQRIITIVDFEPWVKTKFQISSDKEYVKETTKNGVIYHKRGDIRYGQQIYEKIDHEISKEWKKMIAEIKPNGGLEVYGVFHVHQEDREIEYHPFDENMTRDTQEANAVAATDASVKDGRMEGR